MQKHDGTVQFNALPGVRHLSFRSASITLMLTFPFVQDEQIYVTYLRASQHTFVKDQHIFEERTHLILFVQLLTIQVKIIVL